MSLNTEEIYDLEFQMINGHYISDGAVRLYGRTSPYVKIGIDFEGFLPYFYVQTNAEIPFDDRIVDVIEGDFEDPFGVKLMKIVCKTPSDVPDIRSNFDIHWEADVNFVHRFMIDHGIYSGFKIKRSREYPLEYKYDNIYKVHHSMIEPCSFTHPPNYSVMDIEMHNEDGKIPTPESPIYPVTCLTIYENVRDNYLTIFLSGQDTELYQKKENWFIKEEAIETDLEVNTYDFLRDLQFDVFTNWNMKFDYDNLKARSEKFNIKTWLPGISVIDLIPFYRKIRGKSFGNRLKDVAIEEKLATKETMVASEFDPELYNNPANWEKFLQYSFDDVKYPKKLIDKYEVISFHWGLKNFTGLPDIELAQHDSYLIESLLFHESEYILPSVDHDRKRRSYIGAKNIKPKPGLYKGVTLLDFEKFFPLTIIMFNYSPEYAHLTDEERFKMPLGLAGRLCLRLIENRNIQDKRLTEILRTKGIDSEEYRIQKLRRDTAKFLLNAVYGVFGYPKFRLYSPEVNEAMVAKAMEGLFYIARCAEDLGFKVLYGHTDSVVVHVDYDKIEWFTEQINKRLEEYAKNLGLKPLWNVKAEAYGDIIFGKAKGEDRGAATKYAFKIIEKDGVKVDPYIIIKGFETIRQDSSKITKDVQKECIAAIFDETVEDFAKNVKQMIKDIKSGNYALDDISIPVGLSQEVSDYGGLNIRGNKKGIPDYVRGAQWSIQHLGIKIGKDDRVKKLFVKTVDRRYPPTDIISYFDEHTLPQLTPDYDKIIDKTIRSKIEPLLEVVGFTWDHEIKGKKRLTSFLK